MEFYKRSVSDLLLSSERAYLIPPYQRSYSWTQERWQTLIHDVCNKVTSPEKKHWVGIVVTAKSEARFGKQDYKRRQYDLIDGQQRLITLRVWIQALLDHAKQIGKPITEELPFVDIAVQETDKNDFEAVLTEHKWRQSWTTYDPKSSSIMHCYTYFRWILWLGENALIKSEPEPLPKRSRSPRERDLSIEEQWVSELSRRASRIEADDDSEISIVERGNSVDPEKFLKATLENLSLMELERDDAVDEEPVEIFEALNGKRTQLDQFDHVKTFLFSNIRDLRARYDFYEKHWKNFESALTHDTNKIQGKNLNELFLYDYLISLGETRYQSISINRTASSYARYFRNRASGTVFEVIRDDFLRHMRAWICINRLGESLVINGETFALSGELKRRLRNINALSQGPVTPILLRVIANRIANLVSEEDLLLQVAAIERFLGRTVLSRVPLSPLRAELMKFMGSMNSATPSERIIAQLDELAPDDDKIREALLGRYVNKQTRYAESANIGASRSQGGLTPKQLLAIFQVIEHERAGNMRHNLFESQGTERFTIEHIYPQDSNEWERDIRAWSISGQLMNSRLHTLGNLGVIPQRLNAQLSNRSFSSKRDICLDKDNGFPLLRVNEYWLRPEQVRWTPDDIDKRADQLLTSALKFWKKLS